MAMSSSTPARNEFFQQLKSCCVPLSRLALGGAESAEQKKELLEHTEELHQTISRQINKDASVFDEKIAEYIFFPLVHIFRQQHQHSTRLIEASLKCLTALIVHGWKAKISPKVVEQLLVLLTFIVGGVPNKDEPHDIPEETTLEALRALTALLTAAGSSPTAAASLVDATLIPALGHCVTVLLEAVTAGKTPEVQLEALRALQALFNGVNDHAALATFLPGVVSSLTKFLSTPAREKARVLEGAITNLKLVLTAVLGDIKTRSIMARPKQHSESVVEKEEQQKVLSCAWLKATVSQVKLALATVFKLRSSKSPGVRQALSGLALTLLDECHMSLENCTSILTETAIIVEPEDQSPLAPLGTSLTDLATLYPEIGESVKTTVYNWIVGLPRVMQSADEGIKQASIQNILKGNDVITRLQLNSSTLEEAIALALRDSVSLVMGNEESAQPVLRSVSTDPEIIGSGNQLTKHESIDPSYQHVIMAREGQWATRSEIVNLVSKIGSASQAAKLAMDLLDHSREASGTAQVASYWISFELIKSACSRTSDVDEFLDLSSAETGADDPEPVLQELYAYSATLLDSHSDATETDWRLEAIAMEVAAFCATRSGEAFRPELIDVLYPVATFLGSPNQLLREHAVTTLNIVASSCEYLSVSELIIQNADYMVDSVALRMNTLDISPASTKVLIMMTRLTGPRLIPYLDDVVASIFAALDNYHGYPVFVESLFAVLKEVVDQGVKSDLLLAEGRENGPSTHEKQPKTAVAVGDILDLLRKRKARGHAAKEGEEDIESLDTHPKTAWGSGQSEKSKYKMKSFFEQATGDDEEDEGGEADRLAEEEKPPKTPTYSLLEKVATLTQHYLTSPTPTLRKSLLDLLATVSPTLSQDEDAFLPLINNVWPVVMSRLYDSESFISIASCDALAVLCATAGDFLSSRIKTEWWVRMGKWCRGKKQEALRSASLGTRALRKDRPLQGPTSAATTRSHLVEGLAPSSGVLVPSRSGGTTEIFSTSTSVVPEGTPASASGTAVGGGLGRFASAVQTWEAAVRLLVAIVRHVRVEDELYDQIMALLSDRLGRDPQAQEALEVVNADAVWFAMYENGQVGGGKEIPMLEGVEFPPMFLPRNGSSDEY